MTEAHSNLSLNLSIKKESETKPESVAKKLGFGAEHRLRRRSDFKRVFHHQNKATGKHVVVMISRHGKNYRGPSRLGVVISTKVSKLSVRRHQLKRWVKELFRCQMKQHLYGCDVVVLFRKDLPENGHNLLNEEILKLLPKAVLAADNYQKRPRRP